MNFGFRIKPNNAGPGVLARTPHKRSLEDTSNNNRPCTFNPHSTITLFPSDLYYNPEKSRNM